MTREEDEDDRPDPGGRRRRRRGPDAPTMTVDPADTKLAG